MALPNLQGYYAIRHISESEKTERVFSAIYSIKITDYPARKRYRVYTFVSALEGTAHHKMENCMIACLAHTTVHKVVSI